MRRIDWRAVRGNITDAISASALVFTGAELTDLGERKLGIATMVIGALVAMIAAQTCLTRTVADPTGDIEHG